MKMSEEKLYAVKNDKGQYWEFKDLCGTDLGGFWELLDVSVPFTASEDDAKNTAKDHGGNVVTLIEEPKKVVLTKEQAEIVEDARDFDEDPAGYISDNTNLAASGEEELLMRAYVNGYTVAKEKKYMVALDGLVTTDGAKQYLTNKNGKWFASRRMSGLHQDFTDKELNAAPEWVKQLNREEVTDDEV